jgi:hypothetical protein
MNVGLLCETNWRMGKFFIQTRDLLPFSYTQFAF